MKQRINGIHASNCHVFKYVKMKLFAWGTNSHGQLGQGFESELVPIPSATQLPEDLEKEIFDNGCQISGGGNHSLICVNGSVWGSGLDSTEQLCSVFGKKSASNFSKIYALSAQHISTVACGWDFSLFLHSNGIIHGCGSNTFNQLGSTSKVKAEGTVIENIDKPKFVQVTAGLRHAAAVTSSGCLHVWGTEKYVKQATGLPGIAKVSCGQHHIVALMDTHDSLVAWGANHHGQCGQNSAKTKHVLDPSQILWDKQNGKIVDVVCGWTHVLILTDLQHVYSWGRNTYGQLGRASGTNDSHLPTRIPELEGVVSIAAGSEHSMALDKQGQLWTWGWNEHGSLGNGNVENQFRPVNVSHHFPNKIKSIGSGAGHSFAIVE